MKKETSEEKDRHDIEWKRGKKRKRRGEKRGREIEEGSKRRGDRKKK